MDQVIMNLMMQGVVLSQDMCTILWKAWHWTFWAGFFLGLLGAVVSFFSKAPE